MRHQVRAQSRNHTEAQGSLHRVVALAGELPDVLDHLERDSRPLDDLFADRRRYHVVLVALE